jgi:hypothetical protein
MSDGDVARTRPKADTADVDIDTQYAMTADGIYIAYQVAGEGSVDVAWQTGFVNHVDLMWEGPTFGPLLRAIASFARLIVAEQPVAVLSREGKR